MIQHVTDPPVLLGIAVGLLVGIVLHNLAQVALAGVLGDTAPRAAGLRTAKPQRHFTVFGVVPMVLVGSGWATPVPLTERFRGGRGRRALALAIGPVVYLVLCAVGAVGYRLLSGDSGAFTSRLTLAATFTLATLFIVSLVPVPPLDAGRIMLLLAPNTLGWQKARYQLEERNIGVAIALGLLLLPLLLGGRFDAIGNLANALLSGLLRLVGVA